MRAALLLAMAVAAAAQTSTVEGRVVSSLGSDPVRRASVSLGRPGQTFTVETNSSGAFRVDGLTPGSYAISVQRTGFLPGGRREFEIGPGARISGIVVTLTPTAVITGRIVDSDGDPISGATVQAMSYGYVNGRRRLKPARFTTSDDRGLYRFFDLPPGRYFMQATRLTGSQGGMLLAFHPSARDASSAAPVRAAAGVESRGIDVVMQAQALYNVRIRLMSGGAPAPPPGRPGPGVPVFMSALRRRGVEASASTDRQFSLRMRGDTVEATDIPPGSYVFSSTEIIPGAVMERRSVRQRFDVIDRDVEFTASLAPPLEIAGTLTGPADPSTATIRLDAVDEMDRISAAGARPSADGRFKLTNVSADRYIARVTPPEGYYLKAIRYGGRDLPAQTLDLSGPAGPLEFRLADDGGEIAGLVLDAEDRTVRLAEVALEPVASDWPDRFRMVRADANGNFRIHDVAPGEYRVFALVGDEADEPRAVKVRVEPNGDHRVTVRIP